MTAAEKLTGAPLAAAVPVAAPTTVTPSVTPAGGIETLTPPVPPALAPAPAPAPAPGPAAPRAPAAEKDFLTQQQALEKRLGTPVDKLRAEREAITTEDVRGRREGIAALKADQEAEAATMFKGQEERLGKREAALEKSKDTNTGMAFLEAGLAMMQSRGRGLAGIAEGASVGTKQYASGIKDIRAAQEKLDDARDRMEELRQNQASMNKREIRAEEKGIRDTLVQGKRDLLTGVEKATDKQTALSLAATASDVAAQGRTAQMQSAERIAANSITRATMADERADARSRVDSAKALLKSSADMLSGSAASMLSDTEKKTYLDDYNAAKALLQKMGGTMAAAPAPAPTAAAGWGKPTVIKP